MSRFMTSKPWVDPAESASKTLVRCGQPRLANGRAIDVERIAREFCKVELMFIFDLNPSGKSLLGLYTPILNAIMVNSDNIEVRQPSLDDVFFSLTGGRIEEGDGPTDGDDRAGGAEGRTSLESAGTS